MIGSFLNALIYRIPRGINIAFPRSSCPGCKKVIYWYENIPILSFLLLRGRCSKCGYKIGIRYLVVEVFVGIASLYLAPRGLSLHSLTIFLLEFSILSAFVVHFAIDLEHKILPDSVNIYLMLSFLMLGAMRFSWTHIASGGLLGFGMTYGVTWIFYLLRGKVGLGGGDIKLFGVLGLYLGPVGIVYNIFLSCFLGAVIGGAFLLFNKLGRETQIPFGPFIILTACFQIFFNEYYQLLIQKII